MFMPLIAALAVAALFYVAIPVTGAFFVRASWRRFRAAMLDAARLPTLGYAALVSAEAGSRFRMSGGLEAMEGADKLWIRGGSGASGLSVSIDMRHVRLYSLPAGKGPAEPGAAASGFIPGAAGAEPAGYDETGESPESLSWKGLPALVEGSRVFVSGTLVREGGRACLAGGPKAPAIVVIYGCPERELLSRSLRQGRQPNEYWNRLTPISFGVGFAWMIVILLSFMRGVFIEDIFLMSAIIAFIPLSPMLPPGLFLYLLYRGAWKRARSFRAARDSLIIPCAAFPGDSPETVLPDGEPYARRFRGGNEPFAASEDVRLRGYDLPLSLRAGFRGFTCFGVPGPDSEAPLSRPADPMAEHVAVPGVPEELSRRCLKRAGVYTVLAGMALASAVAVNSVIAFAIFKALL